MTIPTEPIGSIPRPLPLVEAARGSDAGDPRLEALYEAAVRDTLERFEATGSPVVTDGEQRKQELPGYPRERFLEDLLNEHETEVRSCLGKGAHKVQIDFTEGRLALKLDPSGALLHSFVDLNNLALSRFPAGDRQRLGVHTCPGGHLDSTHSADVGYADLLPSLYCGFSPFFDDTSTSRDKAFAKIRARVLGTELAAVELGMDDG